MTIYLSRELLAEIQAHGEQAYPEEGAGLLLGRVDGEQRRVLQIISLPNTREDGARQRRYLISPADYIAAEEAAIQAGLDVLGVFHSHPDHPEHPSEYDREWALPWFSYLITSVHQGRAWRTRSWRLSEDRSEFLEEAVETISVPVKE
ncbi:MAG: M67 family metallopeptidase [Chloroflexi bacterium]|jgi:proteasome lid subunit RPN8/RPN11|nr:M67 family metallopeptidase [Chloroflexota bacterium]